MARSPTQRLFRSAFPLAEMEDFRTSAWSRGTARKAAELLPIFPTVPHALVSAAKLGGACGITLVSADDGETEEHRSYGDLFDAARHAAGRLVQVGVSAGDRVVIVLPTGFEFVIVFCALQIVGAIPIPVYPPMLLERAGPALQRMELIISHASAQWCVANQELTRFVGQLVLRCSTLRVIFTAEELTGAGREAPYDASPDPKGAALIQYTSGSTGNPRGVLLAHENLVANMHALGQTLHISRKDCAVSWLPLYHDMGLIGCLLFSIYWRIPLVLMSPMTFLTDPASWLWAIHRNRGTLTAAPNFAFGRCVTRIRERELEGLDLSSWRVASNGAEPVNLRTVRDFVERFAPYGFNERAMLPVYGLAENSLAAAFPPLEDPLIWEVVDRAKLADGWAVPAQGKGSTAVVGVGQAVPGHTVAVVDTHGAELGEREVGHIVVSGPSVMLEYYRDPEATSAVLKDGWLWSGDLGYVSGGHLFITGRVKDLIILRGRNYYAEDIEKVVERIADVRAGGIVVFGLYDEAEATDRVVVIAETRLTDESPRSELSDLISDRIREYCGVPVHRVELVTPGTIPKTPSGKRQRGLCRERFLKGRLQPPKLGRLGVARLVIGSIAGMTSSRLNRVFRGRPK